MALLEPVLATVAGRGSIPKYVYIYIYIYYVLYVDVFVYLQIIYMYV